MTRWAAAVAALSLLCASACDWGDKKKDASSSSGGASAVSSPAPAAAQDGPAAADSPAGGLAAISRQMGGAASAPSDEASASAGRRLFDGQGGNGALAYGDDAVVAAPYPGTKPRPRLVYTNLHTHAPSDLRTPPPPAAGLPEGSADYPSASAAVSRGANKVLAAFDSFQHKAYDTFAPIISRAGWHAKSRLGTPTPMTPARVTVHHTEGPQTMTEADTEAAVHGIQHYHMAGRAAEGKDVWDDIGYHFLIDGAGRVIEGRPADTLGAHARNANGDNVGIAMMGNFDKIKPTAAQTESLTRLVSFLALKYGQNPRQPGFMEGHQHYDQTSCPGRNMMAILASLRLRVDDQTAQLASRMKTAAPGQFVAAATTRI